MSSVCAADALRYSLLDEPLIRYRRVSDGLPLQASLPQLFVALGEDAVRDFSALRPHQRHPWHAFLVQLAAIALHKAERRQPWASEDEWKAALLALTPDDPDGAAWCLVSPPGRPALLQAAVPGGSIAEWKSRFDAADELDMLVTSKNHDLKAARARHAQAQDWLFALLSLQTQEGFLGAGNYGASRMNGGFASRPGVGVVAAGGWGARWRREIDQLLDSRARTAEERGLRVEDGHALVWLCPWDGLTSLDFAALDPFYIEICRRVRLLDVGDGLRAIATGSKVARIAAKELNGVTGDPWIPVETEAGKALTITAEGFHYKLVAELLFGGKYTPAIAQDLSGGSRDGGAVLVARGVTRGQGKTEGYHERRVPISAKVRGLLAAQQKPTLERLAQARIVEISGVRKLLRDALVVLLNNGVLPREIPKNLEGKLIGPSRIFETAEDARFFEDLNDEIEAADPVSQHLAWQQGLVERAESILRHAFTAGPRSGMQRYRAQAEALSRFHGFLRGVKSPLPDLANHYRQQAAHRKEDPNEFHIEPAGG